MCIRRCTEILQGLRVWPGELPVRQGPACGVHCESAWRISRQLFHEIRRAANKRLHRVALLLELVVRNTVFRQLASTQIHWQAHLEDLESTSEILRRWISLYFGDDEAPDGSGLLRKVFSPPASHSWA